MSGHGLINMAQDMEKSYAVKGTVTMLGFHKMRGI
jgi:hypothetical protein